MRLELIQLLELPLRSLVNNRCKQIGAKTRENMGVQKPTTLPKCKLRHLTV